MVDLGGTGGVPPPSGQKFLRFHAVFGKNWSNSILAPPLGLAPPVWEILDPPLQRVSFHHSWTLPLLNPITPDPGYLNLLK